MGNTVVGKERVSAVVGYGITGGNFSNATPNLPMRIAILAEANSANNATISTDPVELITAQQAGEIYGFGSPIHQVMRILKPINADGIGGIPVVAYAQKEAIGSAAKVMTITPTGTATATVTHYVRVAGRTSVDGMAYAVPIVVGDTSAQIATKIADAIASVLASPVTATAATGVVTATTKWKGLTAQSVNIVMDTAGVSAGITYAVAETTPGSGTPSVAESLALFGSEWNTIVINGYGMESSVLTALESYNGRPSTAVGVAPTGRYRGVVMMPFIALTGSVLEDPSTLTDTRKGEVTVAVCPAPLSPALPVEAAANMAVIFARTSQDNPHLDVQEMLYPDMPAPVHIGAMADYDSRDAMVKKGCSTVELSNGVYKVKDFVTTYHPQGEVVPYFRYCRNLMIDFNVKFGYYLLERANVIGHALAPDNAVVRATNVIKPKQWKAILRSYAIDLEGRGLIASAEFMYESTSVSLPADATDRLDTEFRYQRTPYARIASTLATAGFYYGG